MNTWDHKLSQSYKNQALTEVPREDLGSSGMRHLPGMLSPLHRVDLAITTMSEQGVHNTTLLCGSCVCTNEISTHSLSQNHETAPTLLPQNPGDAEILQCTQTPGEGKARLVLHLQNRVSPLFSIHYRHFSTASLKILESILIALLLDLEQISNLQEKAAISPQSSRHIEKKQSGLPHLDYDMTPILKEFNHYMYGGCMLFHRRIWMVSHIWNTVTQTALHSQIELLCNTRSPQCEIPSAGRSCSHTSRIFHAAGLQLQAALDSASVPQAERWGEDGAGKTWNKSAPLNGTAGHGGRGQRHHHRIFCVPTKMLQPHCAFPPAAVCTLSYLKMCQTSILKIVLQSVTPPA